MSGWNIAFATGCVIVALLIGYYSFRLSLRLILNGCVCSVSLFSPITITVTIGDVRSGIF
ncbi:hypothetical protein PG994_010506 [Apiospora phragmitis]|uniref:Uncharacterized protein n=1 Tax=Apiospora phragmitis TaxID=2905665 RepID=A0ABR1TQ35_9PEZI